MPSDVVTLCLLWGRPRGCVCMPGILRSSGKARPDRTPPGSPHGLFQDRCESCQPCLLLPPAPLIPANLPECQWRGLGHELAVRLGLILTSGDKQIGPVGGVVPLQRSPYGAADHKACRNVYAMVAHDGQKLL